ncbi:MAG: M1 family aminopeptidase [Bacteroidota bacterium]
MEVELGVSKALAELRVKNIKDVNYTLHFDIPARLEQPIEATVDVAFSFTNGAQDLILDFNEKTEMVKKVSVAGSEVPFEFRDGHIIISKNQLQADQNTVSIDFTAGENSLNRNKEYLYTLFVPDRASTAFPCFDQPDIKAIYKLGLTTPKDWNAVANGSLTSQEVKEGKQFYEFEETLPISSYLFSFVAGRFETITETRRGRSMTMYHRETDSVKVKNNVKAIFDLHFSALHWLEDYTEIEMPFPKFDFVAVPSFQYGGMEHPGAILYRASSLFLDETATQNQELSRASLIAHETAHLWFGDLVTMTWFNDVWLKEVFANFMAAKIVNPNFPELNHDLRFLMAHHPRAYTVDRTRGANPIQQELNNLKNAGTLYGAIIYQKSPVIMNHLEQLVGEEQLQNNLKEYLKQYAYGNAGWDELISIIDRDIEQNVTEWSRVWVKEPGRPNVFYNVNFDKEDSTISNMSFFQFAPEGGRKEVWPQKFKVLIAAKDSIKEYEVDLKNQFINLNDMVGTSYPDYIMPNSDGFGYGYFGMREKSTAYLLANVHQINDPLLRGSFWINMWEGMLEEKLAPAALADAMIEALLKEQEALNLDYITSRLSTLYWKFLSPEDRLQLAPKLESVLLNQMLGDSDKNKRTIFYRTFRRIAITENGIEVLRNLWESKLEIDDITLSESDYTQLAYELAVREVDGYQEILNSQLERIKNPDRKARMAFVIKALAHRQEDRDAFFESLKNVANRQHEPWVLEALRYLHHPLRAEQSAQYIGASLDMLEEIQTTGDIFFPKRWLDNTLGGHQSEAAADAVRQFLYRNNRYPKHLKNKILQSSDLLFRAEKIIKKSKAS